MQYFGAVEAGGSKIVVAVAQFENNEVKILDSRKVPTTKPEETLPGCVSFFNEFQEKNGKLSAVGIASFGPVDLKENSPTYGYITSTPKKYWNNCNILGVIKDGVGADIPYGFDTDVNGAALAMIHYFNAGKEENSKISSLAYCTVGTGIGVGVVANNAMIHGLLHPETGHIYVPRAEGDTFKGNCPYHNDCLEGLCGSTAIASRSGINVEDLDSLPDNDPSWEYTAHYLAHLCVNLTLAVSPEVIVIGGGISQREILFPMIRKKFLQYLNGYIQSPKILNHIDEYIVPSPYGQDAGIFGATHLARHKLQ